MAEPRDPLSAAFIDLATSMLPEVDLPGPDAAHATLRRRRRRRLAVIAGAVAVLILAPATAIALLRGQVGTEPDIGDTPSPSATLSPSATASPQPPALQVIRDNNTPTPLDDALLPLPSFGDRAEGCPVGETQYTDGTWQGAQLLADPPTYVESSIGAVATGDVNRDGVLDWIAGLGCTFGTMQGASASQVVAFTRQGDGRYTLLGPVIVLDSLHGAGLPEVTPDGLVRLMVSGPYEGTLTTHEWHSFRWNGSSFTPDGSPVVVPTPPPTDLTLTATPSTLSGPVTVLSVAVRNAGPVTVEHLVLTFTSTDTLASLSIRPDGFATDLRPYRFCRPAYCLWSVTLEPVEQDQTRTGQFTVAARGEAGGQLAIQVQASGPHHVPNVTSRNRVVVPIEAG